MKEYLDRLKKILKQNSAVIIRYSIVGAIGTAIDIGGLYILVQYFKVPVLLAATLSFILAVINNFLLNKKWTFKSTSSNNRKLFIKFLIVHITGLSLNLLGMYILVNILKVFYILAKIFVTGLVLIWNFLANKLWTFRINERRVEQSDGRITLSIIIPAYNEEKRIGKTLNIFREYFSQRDIIYEIIAVDDGSDDGTGSIIAEYADLPLKYLRITKNKGKGNAIKRGIELASGKIILFTDADNSTPINELDNFLKAIREDENIDFIIGSRYLDPSSVKIRQSRYRILVSRVGNYLIQLFLLDGIKDTQCGFKLYRAAAAKEIFQMLKVKRFGFDIEAMVIAKNLGFRFKELPVSWINAEGSRLRPVKDVLITARDLIFIKLNLWAGRYNRD